jgi:hypothetical protein
MKQAAVYIVTNKRNGTLYVGVTSNTDTKKALFLVLLKNMVVRCWFIMKFIAMWNAPLQEKNKIKAV